MKRLIFSILLSCPVLWSATAIAGPPHPSKAWTDAEKAVFREALREWLKDGLTFTEETDCTKQVDFTVRWEDADFFKKWDNDHDWSMDVGRVLTSNDVPPGWGEAEKKIFPLNEIYFRSDLAGGWFIDPTPGNDVEYMIDGEGNLRAKNDGPAFGLQDYLTIAKHEIGHVLGLDHAATGVMQDSTPINIRRHPTAAEVDLATAMNYTYKFINVPEPATLSLIGICAIALLRRRSM